MNLSTMKCKEERESIFITLTRRRKYNQINPGHVNQPGPRPWSCLSACLGLCGYETHSEINSCQEANTRSCYFLSISVYPTEWYLWTGKMYAVLSCHCMLASAFLGRHCNISASIFSRPHKHVKVDVVDVHNSHVNTFPKIPADHVCRYILNCN